MKLNALNLQPKNSIKKLQLKKETIKVLQSSQLSQVVGGMAPPSDYTFRHTDSCVGQCSTNIYCDSYAGTCLCPKNG